MQAGRVKRIGFITINGASITSLVAESIQINPPLLDVEVTSNKESVQIGYLLDKPLEDFEIFHSSASRVLLIQIWESLNDSLKSEVKISEGSNSNRVFSLPKKEAKGSPFYDSFVYARDKYGPQKYFVWYSDWYSTEDIPEIKTTQSEYKSVTKNDSNIKQDPKPLVVIKNNKDISGPPLPPKSSFQNDKLIDISLILEEGFLMAGIKKPKHIKALQRALISLGYNLGDGGENKDGVDGDFGPITEDAVIEFQLDRGFNTANVDGIVGEGTHKELMRALNGKKPIVTSIDTKTAVIEKKAFNNNDKKDRKTAKELLNQPPVKTKVKRETRKLANIEEVKLLPLDLTKRKTFLKLSCNLDGANVFIDGSLIGKTPIPKKLPVTPGWHRVRVVNPKAPPTKFAMVIPDYQDIYVPQGRTQKIRINLAIAEEESD